MMRAATAADLPVLFAIRDAVGESGFTQPAAMTEEYAEWLLRNGPIWIWQEADAEITGFSAGDRRNGTICALFVAPGAEGRGVGRALLKAACDTLHQAGHTVAQLSTPAGSTAERHFRSAGWTEVGRNGGAVVFQKPL